MSYESRAYTKEEARALFMDGVQGIVEYWAKRAITPLDAAEGVAFGILNIIDGATCDLPAFDLTPAPHPDAKDYAIENGLPWFEGTTVINDDVNLHEMFKFQSIQTTSCLSLMEQKMKYDAIEFAKHYTGPVFQPVRT